MTFDWQALAVALIIFAACFYTARRGLVRLRSLRGAKGADSSATCAAGCGSCGEPKGISSAPPAKALVQIGRAKAETSQRAN